MPSPADRTRRRLSLLIAGLGLGLGASGAGAKPDRPASRAAGRSAKRTSRSSRAVREDDAPDAVTYGRREDVLRFAQDVAARQGLDAAALEAVLVQARFQPSVARAVMPPPAGTAKNWAAYRARFVEPRRIRAGVAFWATNAAALQAAEARFGVSAAVIVGIIGVETMYGQHMGNYRVLDALATLSFDFPPGRRDRSPFFREELEAFLVMCQHERLDPLTVRGSYAGAMGLPQFMPSSINRHAIDFDGDGHVDLRGSPSDAIGSVANFLVRHGWERDMPAVFDVEVPVDTAARAQLLGPDIVPLFSPQEFVELGARLPDAALAHEGKLALVELQNGDAAPSYVAGTTNFYALTRYNWSSYYAMAVLAVGDAVQRAR